MDWLILGHNNNNNKIKPAKKAIRRKKLKQRLKQRQKQKPKDFSFTKTKTKTKTKGESQDFQKVQVYAPHNYVFNIFPPNTFPRKIEIILAFMKGITVREQKYSFTSAIIFPCKDKAHKQFFDNSMNKFWTDTDSGETIETVLRSYVKKIRTLRAPLRRFLHVWRSSRLRCINTEDVVTMEPPKDPVYIVDWSSGSKSVFEASTLMRDITQRLLHHDGFFDCIQHPRNPYTNLPLTQSQKISVWNQLARSKTPASSAFTGFRQCRWILLRFVMEYNIQLQLHAFRTTMRTPTHQDYRERLSDFIQFSYEQEDIDYPGYIISKALLEVPNHPLLKLWASLCTRYYEANIIYSKVPYKIITIQEDVLDKTIPLTRRHKELLQSNIK
jgi:hypothetical protein